MELFSSRIGCAWLDEELLAMNQKHSLSSLCSLVIVVMITLDLSACGVFAPPTPTLGTQVAELDFASQVQSVSPSTHTIGIARTAQGLTTVSLANGAVIGDSNGNALSFQDLRPGVLVRITGQIISPTTILASDVIVLTPSAEPTLVQDESLAEGTVKSFLAAYTLDPNGNTTLSYLSQSLQTTVASGTSVPQMLGVPSSYPSFNLDPIGTVNDPDHLFITVTFNFQVPVQRIVQLVREGGQWRIDRVTVP
jgi:hypothetical protein